MNPSEIETLRSFYLENRQHLYTYAVSITQHRESAEDAIQQTFQNLLRRGPLPADLRPYIFRCVRNAALDGLRKSKTRGEEALEDIFAEPNRETTPGAASIKEIKTLLCALSDDEQETVVLKLFDGFSFQEIADLRRVPLATAASWYRRGLDKMRAILSAENQ